eukprot:SAG31_NODE_126_length_23665_cov_6.178987_19_plen_40_part_00
MSATPHMENTIDIARAVCWGAQMSAMATFETMNVPLERP